MIYYIGLKTREREIYNLWTSQWLMSLHALPCPRENITHKFVAHCKALTHAGHRWSKLFQVDPRPLRLGLAFNGSNYISNDLHCLTCRQPNNGLYRSSDSWFIQSGASPNLKMPWKSASDNFDMSLKMPWNEQQICVCSFHQHEVEHARTSISLSLTNQFFLSMILRPKCNRSRCFQYHEERHHAVASKLHFPTRIWKLVIG